MIETIGALTGPRCPGMLCGQAIPEVVMLPTYDVVAKVGWFRAFAILSLAASFWVASGSPLGGGG